MGHSQYDDVSRERAAWNAGKKVGTKRKGFTPMPDQFSAEIQQRMILREKVSMTRRALEEVLAINSIRPAAACFRPAVRCRKKPIRRFPSAAPANFAPTPKLELT